MVVCIFCMENVKWIQQKPHCILSDRYETSIYNKLIYSVANKLIHKVHP